MGFWLFFLAAVTFGSEDRFELANIDVYRSTHFAVSPAGLLAVIDDDEKQLILVRFQGEIVARCGRKGQGPGEFANPGEVYWIPREKVFIVSDFGNDRFSKWNETGTLVQEFPKPWGTANPTFPDAQHLIIAKEKRGERNATPSLVKYHIESKKESVLYEFNGPKPKKYNTQEARDRIKLLTPWDSMLLFHQGSDFLVVTFSDGDEFKLLDFEGNPTKTVFRSPFSRPPVAEASVQEWILEKPAEFRDQIKSVLIVPDHWPNTSSMVVGPKDRIWLFGFQNEDQKGFPFRVFSKTGQELASGSTNRLPVVIVQGAFYAYDEQADESVITRSLFSFDL